MVIDVLEVQEGSTGDSVAMSANATKKGQQDPSTIASFELESPKDESHLFELYCLSQDLSVVRHHLQQVWGRYQEGTISLKAATVVTAAAIHCIKDLEEDLADRCPLFSKHPLRHFDVLCEAGRLASISPREANAEIVEDREHLELSIIERTIANFSKRYHSEPLYPGSKYTRPPFAVEASSSTWASYSAVHFSRNGQSTIVETSQIIKEDYRLSKLFIDYGWVHFHRIIAPSKRDLPPAEDIISQGMRLVLEKDRITIWTVFACRVLLDVQDILGPGIESGHGEMLQQASNMVKDLDLRTAPNGNLEPRDGWMWDESSREVLGRAWYIGNKWIVEHAFSNFKEHTRNQHFQEKSITPDYIKQNSDWLIVQDPDYSYFSKQNILHCGTICLSLTLDMELCGLKLANCKPAILVIVHLYNASKQLQ